MNFKKFKKSLVSIVLGSSLFLGNGGICKQPKAWFSDNFFTTARETYKDDQNIQLLLTVSEFLSDLSKTFALNTKPAPISRKLLKEAETLRQYPHHFPYLNRLLSSLTDLSDLKTRTTALATFNVILLTTIQTFEPEKILKSETPGHYEKAPLEVVVPLVAALLIISNLPETPDQQTETQTLATILPKLRKSIAELQLFADQPTLMLQVLDSLFPPAVRNLT